MSTKKYPRAKISRHPNLNGWVIDLIQRDGAKPKRVAATYATIPWADHAARLKLGLNPTPPKPLVTKPAPIRQAPAAVLTPKPAPKPREPKNAGTCIPCGRDMRPAGTKASDYPGTVLRQREGLCQSCNHPKKTDNPKKRGTTVAEDVEFLAKTGASREEISQRIGSSWPTIARQLQRMGRNDLIELAQPADPDKAATARKAQAA
jgi:hypothetical protein